MNNVLDIFKGDVFSVISLTDAINKMPFIPGRAGQVIGWNEQGVDTLTIMIEEVGGELRIINPSPRGGPGETIAKNKRKVRSLALPHYQIDDAIYADEVQGVRAFGQTSQVEVIQTKVAARIQDHVQLKHDPTLEYQRVGAVKGIILNGDGSTLYDLYSEFGVSAPAVVNFDLDADAPASGAIRTRCTQVVRTIATALGGVPYAGIYAFCGDAFFDALVAAKETRETFLNQQEASQLRGLAAYQIFDYGGIRFENYRGAVGNTPFIASEECRVFPIGVPGLFKTVYGPADYVETVNTIGLPRYARQFAMPNGKGVELETQMNPLSYCTRPNVLVQGELHSG